MKDNKPLISEEFADFCGKIIAIGGILYGLEWLACRIHGRPNWIDAKLAELGQLLGIS